MNKTREPEREQDKTLEVERKVEHTQSVAKQWVSLKESYLSDLSVWLQNIPPVVL